VEEKKLVKAESRRSSCYPPRFTLADSGAKTFLHIRRVQHRDENGSYIAVKVCVEKSSFSVCAGTLLEESA
jgi:hypothetical protein